MSNQDAQKKSGNKKVIVKKTNSKNTKKKKFKVKAWMIILVLIIAAGIALISWLGGWSAYTENSIQYNDVVGTWEMDSRTVNTVNKWYTPTVLVFDGDKTGTITRTETITPEKENADGTVTPAVTKDTTTDITIDVENEKSEDGRWGYLTITENETVTEYEFSVDEDAGILHLVKVAGNGDIVHFYYDLVE